MGWTPNELTMSPPTDMDNEMERCGMDEGRDRTEEMEMGSMVGVCPGLRAYGKEAFVKASRLS